VQLDYRNGMKRAAADDAGGAIDLPTLQGIVDAETRLRPFSAETPLIRSTAFSRQFDADVWLKIETISPVASFKWRGALNHLMLAQDSGTYERAVTSSTGNHGQGVTYAAGILGLKADIFLPVVNVAVKKRMIELLGGTIHEIGKDIDAAKDAAHSFASLHGAVFVDDGESLAMMEGAGTVGLEISRCITDIDRVYVPMGSGVLATGVATAVKALQPDAEIIAVQSEGAPAMVESFRLRKPVERPIDTFADGIVCRVPAHRALQGILATVDDCRLVTDLAILGAMHTMMIWGHILAEPGSASVLARAYEDRSELAGRRVVLVVTGANVDGQLIARALSTSPLWVE
jgi:threonine dehydratase